MANTTAPPETEGQPIDDYHVERHVGELTRSAAHYALTVTSGLMLIVLAVVSFALFWVVATLLGIL